MARGNLFRTFRIAILLVILVFTGFGTWLGQYQSTNWNDTLWVNVYPINGDGYETTQTYIESLSDETFADVEQFMSDEALRFGIEIEQPMEVGVQAPVESTPPEPPYGGNVVQIALWSLSLRLWAWRHSDGPPADIKVYVVYYDPEEVRSVAHSLGIERGRIGVVHAFAEKRMDSNNSFVVMHEILHTLGATDKYDPDNNYPVFPEGFAEPELTPTFPQHWTEIMGGRRPVTRRRAEMPDSLEESVVGDTTAAEIRWLD